jgi:hypothetical protein
MDKSVREQSLRVKFSKEVLLQKASTSDGIASHPLWSKDIGVIPKGLKPNIGVNLVSNCERIAGVILRCWPAGGHQATEGKLTLAEWSSSQRNIGFTV